MPEPHKSAASTHRTGRPPLTEGQRVIREVDIAYAAVCLFINQGVRTTSVEQIAARADISTRTFWRHFATKESSVRPLLMATAAVAARGLAALPAGGGLPAALAELHAEYTAPDPQAILAALRLVHIEQGIRAEWLTIHHEAERRFAELVAALAGRQTVDLVTRVRAAGIVGALRVAAEHYADCLGAGTAPSVEGLQAVVRKAVLAVSGG